MNISHEEFIMILKEKDRYVRMKYNLISENRDEKQGNIKLNNIEKIFSFFLLYTKMLEITRKNCYKCDLETNIDNNSQYFWINLRDFEVERESKWLNMFNKHGNKSTLKYRRELTPNIKFQADRIFVKNDLFEQVIKSYKATNIEFLMLKKILAYVFIKKITMKKKS